MVSGGRTAWPVFLVALLCTLSAVHPGRARVQAGDPYEIVATRNVMAPTPNGALAAGRAASALEASQAVR